MNDLLHYSIADILRTGYAFIVTKFFYRKARLIRRPFHIRGKKYMEYGRGFTVGYSCRFEIFGKTTCLHIGESCHLGDNVHIVASEEVVIGDNLLCASKVFISDTSHGNYHAGSGSVSSPEEPPTNRPLYAKPVHIGNNVWLGENVVVLAGATIGNGCIIGSNATVTGNIPDDCIAVGSPARPIKKYDRDSDDWINV
jgi:acetyltransferase-like isoleucine patch superfamily enzyme